MEEGETEEPEMMAGETLEVVCSLEEAWPVTRVAEGSWLPGPAIVT